MVPPPPASSGPIHLYPGVGAPELQSRSGDCGRQGTCSVYAPTFWGGSRWQSLPSSTSAPLALLSLTMPVASAYSPTLFTKVNEGLTDEAILLNTTGEQRADRGVFDGLRMGIRRKGNVIYYTAYAVEPRPFQGSWHLTETLWTGPIDAEVVLDKGKAWLLQRRPDHSANLIDLFEIPQGPVLCLAGLIIDTDGKWAGPPEIALSPDLFVNKVRMGPDYKAHVARVLNTCKTQS